MIGYTSSSFPESLNYILHHVDHAVCTKVSSWVMFLNKI